MNFDDYEQLPTTNIATNMTAGAIAGVMEHCVMYPLDSVKTRMQSLSPLTAGHTISTTFNNMIRNEGLLRPMRGMGVVVLGAGPAHALYFSTYEYSKELFAEHSSHNQINYVFSATVATLIHDAISNPAEVVKQRLQMYNSKYNSVWNCAKNVYKNEGFRAFYRSYTTQLVMNLPYQAIHFTTYELFQNRLNKDHQYNPPVHMVAGAAAGATAAAVTTPLDVCKTLLNTQEDGVGKTKGLIAAASKVYKAAGMSGFFKGMQARVLYQMPATAICWSTYEFFKYLLSRTHKSKITATTGATGATTKEDITLGSSLRYVLPTTSVSTEAEMPAAIRETTSLKPRELPAMSSAGMYGALSFNTKHNETETNITHLTDLRRKSGDGFVIAKTNR